MRSKVELDSAMERVGFKFDPATGGYRKELPRRHPLALSSETLWVSSVQAREALRAAENDQSWTEEDVEPLSETLARRLVAAGIH